jgi:hypothetical protein
MTMSQSSSSSCTDLWSPTHGRETRKFALIELLARFEVVWPRGRVLWFTGDDPQACRLCGRRDGRRFTYDQAREHLANLFCARSENACVGTFIACPL